MRHPFLRALLPAILAVVAGRELQQVEITAAPTMYRTYSFRRQKMRPLICCQGYDLLLLSALEINSLTSFSPVLTYRNSLLWYRLSRQV